MVSLYSLLWVGLGWLGISMVNANYVEPYYALHGRLLKYFVIIFVVFLVSIINDHRTSQHQARNRFWILSLGTTILLVLLCWNQMKLRSDAWKPYGIHDGALHTEVAADFLLQGKNPYGADYSITPYKLLDPPIPGGPSDNIVWYHYMYPPTVALTQAIVTFIAHRFGQPGDFRFVTMFALFILWWLLVRRPTSYDEKTKHTLAILANPLLWIYVLPGHNDILSVAALSGSMILAQKKKFGAAGIVFGLALGYKQSVWIAVPLVAVWLWKQWKKSTINTKDVRGFLLGSIGIVVVTFLPFFIWSPYHFYNDLVRYASGSIPYAYAISGSTILQYLVTNRLVASPYSVIPTWIFQVGVGLPMLVLTGWWLNKRPTASQLLSSFAVLTFTILMFSRYFNANYFSAIFALLYVSYALREPAHPTSAETTPA
jgi:hypothetical protein